MKDICVLLDSAILNRSIPIRMLIPEGENLKCLVLLHGYGGDHNQWCEKSILSQLAQEHHMAVIMPSCGDGYYEDTLEDLPAFLGQELVSYVRKAWPISPQREDLYIGGVSMGGFGALLIGAKFPEVFGKIAAFSGAFIITDVAIGNQGVLGNANPNYFKRIFGDLAELEGSDRDPVAVATWVGTAMPPVYLTCGKQDVLHRCNLRVVEALRTHGVSVTWQEGEGSHTWPFWNKVLPDVMAWLATP